MSVTALTDSDGIVIQKAYDIGTYGIVVLCSSKYRSFFFFGLNQYGHSCVLTCLGNIFLITVLHLRSLQLLNMYRYLGEGMKNMQFKISYCVLSRNFLRIAN